MSGIFVKETGFEKKTLEQIKEELEADYKAIYGDDVDLDPRGPLGQQIGITAKSLADLWDGAEEIYTARNPNEATGKSLDDISAETGVKRIDATPTTVNDVLLTGDEGTLVTAGNQAKQSISDLTYSLLSDVTITKSAALKIKLEPNTTFPLSGGEVFTVTLDSILYQYTGIALDEKSDVIDGLIAVIEAGSFIGSVSNENDRNLVVDGNDSDSDSIPDISFTAAWSSTLDLNQLSSGGDFEADEDGANTLPANTLNEIVTPVSGWDEVINPAAGLTGSDVETDQALRIRRLQTFLAGNATDEAIKNALLNQVDGVQTAAVFSNRTLETSADGLPPKSFEAVIEGGTDQDVADKIWETQPSGIESYGNTSEIVQDSEGNDQTIKFSRPAPIYIHVKVQRDFYDEEIYPPDGDNQIKENIVNWALANLNPGNDVIRQRLGEPIYDVSGIGDIKIFLDDTPNPGDTPTFAEKNIEISPRELADFDVTRITVEDLP
jgi:uncharacterized phage protein gp47/JayE